MQNKRPKKTKYSKYHKGRISYNLPILKDINNNINKDMDNKLTYQLIALEPCRLTASHLTAIELAIKRKLSTMPNITIMNKDIVENEITLVRKNVFPKLIFKAFPHIPVTNKPAEVRMGKGKGSIDY
jgi:large subunit ribosomal protein L16